MLCMSNTCALLDKARELCQPPTDYRLARTLGISQTTIARCRHRGGTLDNKAVHALAKFLHQDFQEILALVELDRAKTPETKAFWEKLAPRVVPTLVIGLLASADGHSAGMRPTSHFDTPRAVMEMDSLYIMRSLMRWLRRRLRAAIAPAIKPGTLAAIPGAS